jgi:hypothetical protein
MFRRRHFFNLLIVLFAPHAAVIAYDNIKVVALATQLGPGPPDGTTLGSFGLPSIDDSGQAAFRAGVDIFSTMGRVLKDDNNIGLTQVGVSGAPAPGVVDGSTFDRFLGLTQNAAGQLAFYGTLVGPAIDDSNSQGIWFANAHGLKLLVRAGDRAPVGTAGINFAPWLNDNGGSGLKGFSFALSGAGRLAFQSLLQGPNDNDINDRGIFIADAQGVKLVARRNQLAPGLNDTYFDTFLKNSQPPTVNAIGDVAFLARLVGTSAPSFNESLWLQRADGQLHVIVGTNQPAPGASSPGATLTSIYSPRLNNAGEMTFFATISDEQAGINNVGAVYTGAPNHLALVAREHDPAPGADGALFNFDRFDFDQPVINHQGHIAFNARLEGPTVQGSNDTGLWSQGSDGVLKLVAREGDPAPGGGVFGDLDDSNQYVLNGVGQLAFEGTVIFPGTPQYTARAIWAQDRQGALRMIARSRQSVDGPPGFPVDAYDVYFGITSGNEDGITTTFNDHGQLVFTSGDGIYVSSLVAVPEPVGWRLMALVAVGLSFFARRLAL